MCIDLYSIMLMILTSLISILVFAVISLRKRKEENIEVLVHCVASLLYMHRSRRRRSLVTPGATFVEAAIEPCQIG